MIRLASVVVLALLAVQASQAFVIGPNDGVNYFTAGVQVVRNDRTDFVLQPQRDSNPGTTPYGAEAERQYAAGYCAAHPLSLNHFVDGAGVALLVWCDVAGVAHVLQATEAIELLALVSSGDCDIENADTCLWSANLLVRDASDLCAALGDYTAATSYELLMGLPTSRAYSTVGKSWLVVDDLSGAMARFVGTTDGTGSNLVAQLQLPMTQLYPAGANAVALGDTVELACVHQLAPLRFGINPISGVSGPDIYSDLLGSLEYTTGGAALGWWAVPINDVLYPAAADTADKDEWCQALFPGTHAASARHVEIMLQSHVSPFNSFFTFVNSPSFCLANQATYNVGSDQRPFDYFVVSSDRSVRSPFDSDHDEAERGIPLPIGNALFDELSHILRCLPLGVVVADYCAPLLPQSFSPSHASDWNSDWTNQTLLGANVSTSTQLPLLTEAQYALDWCMHNDTCRDDNCNYQSTPGTEVCGEFVKKASQLQALSFTPPHQPVYSRKYATHGVLACTTLPRDAPAVDNCIEMPHFQPDPVCCRDNNGADCFAAPALIDPQHLSATAVRSPSETTFIDGLFVPNSASVGLQFPAFFRLLPNKHNGTNCFTVSSDSPFGTLQVWATGCGYSDDCDAWTHVSSTDDRLPTSVITANDGSFTLPNAMFDCALFIGVGIPEFKMAAEERGPSPPSQYTLTWDPTGAACLQ